MQLIFDLIILIILIILIFHFFKNQFRYINHYNYFNNLNNFNYFNYFNHFYYFYYFNCSIYFNYFIQLIIVTEGSSCSNTTNVACPRNLSNIFSKIFPCNFVLFLLEVFPTEGTFYLYLIYHQCFSLHTRILSEIQHLVVNKYYIIENQAFNILNIEGQRSNIEQISLNIECIQACSPILEKAPLINVVCYASQGPGLHIDIV